MAEPMGETMRIIDAYREAVRAVRALHQPVSDPSCGYCVADDHPWPCPTERAIRAALGEAET